MGIKLMRDPSRLVVRHLPIPPATDGLGGHSQALAGFAAPERNHQPLSPTFLAYAHSSHQPRKALPPTLANGHACAQSLRVLVVTPFLPDPAGTHGGAIYLGDLCRSLARRAEIGLAALVPGHEPQLPVAHNSVFSFCLHQAMPVRPSGPERRRHQARMLVDWGLRRLPLVAAKTRHPAFAALLDRALREFRPDVAMVELAQMAQYLPHLGALPTVFTDHEGGVPANVRTGLGTWADRRDAGLWRSYVRRFYPLAAALQAVTPEDARDLEQLLGRPVAVRPPTVAVPPEPVEVGLAPPRALFLGDYRHGPNPTAAARIAREIWPLVRLQVPAAELWLAGPNSECLQHLAGLPGVAIRGFAPDLASLFGSVRLLLAPLYTGAGVRMKGITALAHGVPVVTNALGARGCQAQPPARFVAETPEALAALAVPLLLDAAFAAAAGRAAHRFARANLDDDAVAAAQFARLSALLGRP